MDIPYHIKYILEKNTIIDILKSRNIYPAQQRGDKIMYHCPLHEGDNDPSFIVYLNSTFQNYYCFGCKKGGNVINLLSDLDKIDLKQTTKKLLNDSDIKANINDDLLDSLIDSLEKININNIDDNDLHNLYFLINKLYYNYLVEVNFDNKEINFFDNLYKKVDIVYKQKKYDVLKDMYDYLLNKGLKKRLIYFRKREKLEKIKKENDENKN